MPEITAEQLEAQGGTNQAADFVIQQLTGEKRTIVLRGRALPLRTPPVEWGGTQHEVNEWYVGNRRASKQILGPRLDPTTVQGEWKDKFLGVGETHPDAAIATVNGTRVLTAEALVELFERVRDEGQELLVTWGRRARTGILQKVVPAFRRRQDILFTLTFSWDGTGAPQAALSTPQTATASQDTRNGLDRAAAAIRDALNLPALVAVQGALDTADTYMDTLAASAADLGDAIGEALGRVRAPLETIQHAEATAERIVDTTAQLRDELDGIVYETIEVSEGILPFLEFLTRREKFKADALTLRAITIDLEQRLQGKKRPKVRRGVRANPGEDLRTLAQRWLGSADSWTVLADFNGLTGSVLTPGQLVLIPDTDNTPE